MLKNRSRFFMRIVTPYFILLILVMSAALLIVYNLVTDRIENNTEISIQELARKTAQQTEAYLNDMELIAQQVCMQTNIVNYFLNISNDSYQGNIFDKDVLSSIDLSSALKKILVDRSSDYNITIYNDKGDFLSSREYITNKRELPSLLRSVDYAGRMAQLEANSGIIILPPEKNPWTHEKSIFITLIYQLKNDYSSTACGIIEVRCNISHLLSIINPADSAGDEVLIINNRTGRLIYPLSDSNPFFSSRYETATIKKADWSIALKVPPISSKGVSVRLALIFAAIYILLAAFLFIITGYWGRYITRPLMELTEYVKLINTPETEIKPPNDQAIDEIKELEDSFAQMLSRMNSSILREKKAYSLALQAQMNPHFLYNSLSVIAAAGSEAGCENVYDMCIRLSDMLRYVAAYEKVTVPLKDEIIHAENYLSLMKFRYEDQLTYSVSVDKLLLNMAVPKLLLQPLLENCFMHGFKGKEPPWNVDIQIRGEPGNWYMIISDNGTGISEQSIMKINKQITDAETMMPVGGLGGLGIANTIIRLKMTHSKRVFYEFRNENGAKIIIHAEDES